MDASSFVFFFFFFFFLSFGVIAMEKAARILLDQIGPLKQCGEDTWAGFYSNSVIHRVD